MTRTQQEKLAEAIRSYTARATASQQSARKTLEDEGIYKPDGRLAPQYTAEAEG